MNSPPPIRSIRPQTSCQACACLAAAALASGFHAAVDAAPPPPRLVEIEQVVEASPPPNKVWIPATKDQPLAIRELIAARDKSRATIQLTESRQLRVRSNSQVRILPSMVSGSPLGLELHKGEVYFHSRESGPGVQIDVPPGKADSIGTQFLVKVAADGTSTFTVFEGTVEMSNEYGKLTLHSNEEGEMKRGSPPRPTSRIVTRNLLQWCMYYPGILHPSEITLTPAERDRLALSVAVYRTGDIPGALAAWPTGYEPLSDSTRLYLAMLRLSVGEIEQTRALLGRIPPTASGRIALEEVIDAVNFQEHQAGGPPNSSTGWLARSYYEQSRTNNPDSLKRALSAARKSWEMGPDFGFAAVRVAELEFSFGHTKEALQFLRKGLELTPRNAQGHALMGFLLAAQNCVSAAKSSFQQAIDLDGSLGNAWLGRGLCSIRSGNLEEGRRDLQTAVVLEPNRSLLHSYLGKANSQSGLDLEATKDLEYAIRIDPHDPTPWLYSALLHQEQNQPNAAIRDLRKSIELNDYRRLYRSSLLLDQDRAVRGANLAKIYQFNGMRDVAVREATRAVESDYTNASAHLFLANSFDALRDPDRILLRYETPWFNELLLSNLLSPVGGGPLSQFVSQEEYSKLLESDGIGGSFINEWRSTSELRSTASLFGTEGKISYGLDAYYQNDPGDRPNSEMRLQELYGQFKWQPSPDDIFYFLGKWAAQDSGDNLETYNNQPLAPGLDFEENQEPGLLLAGWNHRWAPGSNTLFLAGRLGVEQSLADPMSSQLLIQRDTSAMRPDFLRTNAQGKDEFTDPKLNNSVRIGPDGESLIYSPALLRAIAPYVGSGNVTGLSNAPFDFRTHREIEIYSAEIQHIQQSDRHTLLLGGRWQDGRIETDATLEAVRPTFYGFSTPASDQHVESEFRRAGLYAYDYWNVLPCLTLIGGASWDEIGHPENFRNPPVSDSQQSDHSLSGKFGFTYVPLSWLTLRGVAAEGMGGLTFDESVRLEPSQIAGFNQAYRTVISESLVGSVEAPHYQTLGLSAEGSLSSRTWWGASVNSIRQDVNRTLGAFTGYQSGVFPLSPAYFPDDTTQRLDYDEDSLALTLNQLVGDEFSVGAGYRVTRSELRTVFPELLNQAGTDLTDLATLQEFSLYGNWNSPSGLFARLEANWFHQHLDDDPNRTTPVRSGDEFLQFNACAGYRFNRSLCEVSAGVLNIGGTDYRLSPLNPHAEIARDRTFFVFCRLGF